VALAAYAGANFLGTNLNSWYTGIGGAVSSASANIPTIS
jgi:hypothetical protein